MIPGPLLLLEPGPDDPRGASASGAGAGEVIRGQMIRGRADDPGAVAGEVIRGQMIQGAGASEVIRAEFLPIKVLRVRAR